MTRCHEPLKYSWIFMYSTYGLDIRISVRTEAGKIAINNDGSPTGWAFPIFQTLAPTNERITPKHFPIEYYLLVQVS